MTTRRLIAVISITVMTASIPLLGANDVPRLTAQDIFEMEGAVDPQISPDGTSVVYVRQFADIMTDKRYSNLWIVSSDGSRHRPLTTGQFNDGSPRWAPDGRRLAFTSNRSEQQQIHVRWMDTGQTTVVTSLEYPPGAIAWSPDGKWLSFTSLVKSDAPQVAQMPAPPKDAKWAKPARVVDRLVYRFDTAGYLPHGFTHIFVVPSDGGTARQISSDDFNHGGVGLRGGGTPVWTPDAKFLIASANRRKDWEYEPLDNEVYEFSIKDGSIRALTDRRGPDSNPAISPDGSRIAYVGFDDVYHGYQVSRLYVMNRDGTGSRVLTADFDRGVGTPRWSSDGNVIYFIYDDQGNTKIGLVPANGGSPKPVAGSVGSGGSAYAGGASLSLSSQNRIAYTRTTPAEPGDIVVAKPDGSGELRLTAVNEDLLSQRAIGEVEEIWYESSKDGRKIQGWIIKPPDFDPEKKYPLILEIHGGPFANYGDRFDLEKQILAARGYVVLYVNPRGSTSYGKEFGNLIHHAYPGDDFYDLNSGVDAVIAKGYIDESNLFVGGGSGGGVLTCWMIGNTDRFRSAVSYYPVINWYSWVLTADIPSFGVKYWFPGPPWEHTEHYMKRSLLSVVGNVKTPTMVITGEVDYRTPMSESEQYYTALKLRKIESVLVRVPNERHGIRQRPSHHMAKLLNIAGWFDRYRQ